MATLSEMIANQLKEMYNLAFGYVQEKHYREAENTYENILTLCTVAKYEQGKKMAYLSLANLCVVMEEPLKAFQYAVCAHKLSGEEELEEQARQLMRKLMGPLIKSGMRKEQEGDWDEAIEIYRMALPYLGEKQRAMILQELTVLEEYQNGRQENRGHA
ncbi:MAG: hypothetical protein IJ833_03440 [Lachnospiraceae bacterium]|nr:hypothetical protein [Lachnospiraceae bacterium]